MKGRNLNGKNTMEKTLGKFLKTKRMEKKMSLRDAARLTGISHVHLRSIEEGEASPSFDKVMRLLNAYHVTIQELRNETGYTIENSSVLRVKMPDEFIKRLNEDIQKQEEEVWGKISIPKEVLQSVLRNAGILSRKEVIEVAKALNEPVQEYLMLSEYLPEEFEIIKHSSAFDMFRTMNKLSPDEIEKVIDALKGVLALYVNKKSDKRDD